MHLKLSHALIVFVTMWMCACTPKTTEQAQATTPNPPDKPVTTTDPCATFRDSRAGEAALDAHVIYRDFIRREQYNEAIPYWRQAFSAAPAADGQRTTHFDDGVKIYDFLISQQATTDGKKVYLDSILYMYDRMAACYPASHVDGKKAFDLYYNYKALTDNRTIFDYFTNVIDSEGLETPAFVINPFTALLVEMFNANQIDTATATAYAKQILAITSKRAEFIENAPCDMSLKYEMRNGACVRIDASGASHPAEPACCDLADDIREGWPIVLGYAPQQLEAFESVKGFYGCDYYMNKYFLSVNLDSVSCDDLPLMFAKLKWGGCAADDPAFAALEAVNQQRCIVTSYSEWLRCGRDALNEGRYQDAVDCYKKYVSEAENPERRAKYNLLIAKIYYGTSIRNFARSREHARLALKDQPTLGEAYLLIGKLYASSGPLCGPGRGWDSQIVTWPAIDMFNRAKSVDPGVAGEANKLIRDYSKYMPSIEDIFQRQLAEDQSFFVGCWIQESTTIRAAR